MFMHGSWLHLSGNMLFLWIFGNNVEDALGTHARPFLLYPRRLCGHRDENAVTLYVEGDGGGDIPTSARAAGGAVLGGTSCCCRGDRFTLAS